MMKISKLLCKSFALLSLLLIACSNTDDIQQKVKEIDASQLKVRDPFIFYDADTVYYYLHVNGTLKVKSYKSKDLLTWQENGYSFLPSAGFWGKEDFWAPDFYKYEDKYYLFITLSAPGVKRGTSVLVSDRVTGTFQPLVNNAVTPQEWTCLDGSLYVDSEGTPWIFYCREWVEVGDGEIYVQQLKDDLTMTEGEPHLLFKASEAPWVGPVTLGENTGNVTDAPTVYRLESGALLMLWSSFTKDGKYCIGQALSELGNVQGPWVQMPEPLNNDDGGHAMLFKDKNGNLKISYHSPNTTGLERLTIKDVVIENNKVRIIE